MEKKDVILIALAAIAISGWFWWMHWSACMNIFHSFWYCIGSR